MWRWAITQMFVLKSALSLCLKALLSCLLYQHTYTCTCTQALTCMVAVFNGPYGNPYDCFLTGSNFIHVYYYICLCHKHDYVLYT